MTAELSMIPCGRGLADIGLCVKELWAVVVSFGRLNRVVGTDV